MSASAEARELAIKEWALIYGAARPYMRLLITKDDRVILNPCYQNLNQGIENAIRN